MNFKHIGLHFAIAFVGGIYASISCAIFAEAYDQWMVIEKKIGHYEGWNWKDFAERTAGAVLLLPLVGSAGIFMPWWITKLLT